MNPQYTIIHFTCQWTDFPSRSSVSHYLYSNCNCVVASNIEKLHRHGPLGCGLYGLRLTRSPISTNNGYEMSATLYWLYINNMALKEFDNPQQEIRASSVDCTQIEILRCGGVFVFGWTAQSGCAPSVHSSRVYRGSDARDLVFCRCVGEPVCYRGSLCVDVQLVVASLSTSSQRSPKSPVSIRHHSSHHPITCRDPCVITILYIESTKTLMRLDFFPKYWVKITILLL
ncbi:hypothetical protein CBL_12400 [Carabus blaptoides fortunei]